MTNWIEAKNCWHLEILTVFLKKVIHPECKNSNIIKYKMRQIKVPQRHPLGLWEYFGRETPTKKRYLFKTVGLHVV